MTTTAATSTPAHTDVPETDAFMTVHAHAGNAAPGSLPEDTYPALINVRPVVLDCGTPGVVVTATCAHSAVMGITCDDAETLSGRLRDLLDDGKGRHRNVPVQGPDDVREQIPRIGVGLAAGRPVLMAGPTYVLDDAAASMLSTVLLTSAAWAKGMALQHALAL